jgi:hypothetical protein
MLVFWVVVGGIFHKAADRHATDQQINGEKAFPSYITFLHNKTNPWISQNEEICLAYRSDPGSAAMKSGGKSFKRTKGRG